MLEEARVILKQVGQAKIGVRRRARGEIGQLNIGSSGGTYFHPLIPTIIRQYGTHYPDVVMSPAASNTPLLVARLRAGQIDVAFIRPPISDSDGLALDLLVDEPAIMVLPTGHRLCWAASAPLSALAEETFVLCARELNPGNYDSIIAACHRADLLKYRPEVTMQGRLIYPHVSCMAREVSMTTSPCFPPAIAGSPSGGAMHFRQGRGLTPPRSGAAVRSRQPRSGRRAAKPAGDRDKDRSPGSCRGSGAG